MTLNPNLRKIICLVTVDFVCLLLVGVPCLLLWLVGKRLVLQGKRILKYLIRRSIFPWILLWRWNPAAPLQRLHCSNMGTHCCQLRTANYCVQVSGLQNLIPRKLCSFSLVETSRLKRSATFNWTRFLRWSSQAEQVGSKVFFSKDIYGVQNKSNWNFCLQRYLWSPWHLCFWVPGHPTSDWHKQVHNWWVCISLEKYENHLFSLHQVDSDHISSLFVDPMSRWPAPRYHRWFKQIGKLG